MNLLDFLPDVFTEETILNLKNDLIQDAIDGVSDPLELFIQSYALKRLADLMMHDVKEAAVHEAALYNPQADKMERRGAGFRPRDNIARLDFSNDPTWNIYHLLCKLAQEQRKVRGQYLRQKYFEPDLDTGEITVNVDIKGVTPATIMVSIRKK